MRQVRLIGSAGRRTFSTSAKSWGDLIEQLKEFNIDATDYKAQDATSRVTLEALNAILPETNFILSLTPVKIKQGADYDKSFEDEEVSVLPHSALKLEVKSFRGVAMKSGDDEIIKVIDEPESYTRKTTDQLKETIRQMYSILEARKQKEEEALKESMLADLGPQAEGLEERLFEIEKRLEIHNSYNETQWEEVYEEMWKKAREGFPKYMKDKFGHSVE